MSAESDSFYLALVIRPVVSFVLLFGAVVLGRWILSKLPDGKLKTLLSRRVGP